MAKQPRLNFIEPLYKAQKVTTAQQNYASQNKKTTQITTLHVQFMTGMLLTFFNSFTWGSSIKLES